MSGARLALCLVALFSAAGCSRTASDTDCHGHRGYQAMFCSCDDAGRAGVK